MRTCVVLFGLALLTAGCRGSPHRTGGVLFTRDAESGPSVFLVRSDGTGVELYLRHAAYPAVSPDATRIAFVRDGEIWVARRNGTAQRAVTTHLRGWEDASRPAWTADGRTI